MTLPLMARLGRMEHGVRQPSPGAPGPCLPACEATRAAGRLRRRHSMSRTSL
jgi:hypothetical protein